MASMVVPGDGEPVCPGLEGQASPVPAQAVSEVASPQSFDDFYRLQYRPVVALAWSLTGSRSSAEELAQDAFLDAYRQWDRLVRFERPVAWVRRAVSNRAVSRFRQSRTEAEGLRRVGGEPVATVTMGEPDDSFWAAVRTLPERQAKCVALHYLEDRSVADIASILNINSNTVKVHLHRGRLSLAGLLAAEEDIR